MVPRQRRKGKDAQSAPALRAHIETIWAIASTLTGSDAAAVDGDEAIAVDGDEAIAVEVVKAGNARGTLPQTAPIPPKAGLRLEVVIAATEAAASRVSVHLFQFRLVGSGPVLTRPPSVPRPRL